MTSPQPAQAYAIGNGVVSTDALVPVRKQRAPNSTDVQYPDGKLWVNTAGNALYVLTSKSTSSGVTTANWVLAASSTGDIDTLTGDSGGAITPVSNNVDLTGGTNITTVGSAGTITFNLDDAITVATSVTTPLLQGPAAAALDISAQTNQDIDINLGDSAGANVLNFKDAAGSAQIVFDSDGAATFAGLVTGSASATIETAGTALTLAADNSGDAVILGGGTSARAITIGQDAAAHTIAIGQAAAGAITIDSAAGVSIDAGAASNFSVAGAGVDLSLVSAAGRVVVNGEEAAADAIRLLSAAGGLDADVALQLNLVSSQNAADAVVISASAGGIDITAAGAAGEDVDISCTSGSVNVTAGEAAADAIVISASDAAGGITIDAGSNGVNVTGADLDVQGGNILISGAAQQLQVEGGAATDFIGTATLSSGTVTVANTNIAATDRILITRRDINGSTALGSITYSISAATSFTITAVQAGTPGSTETNDVSIVDYFIVRQL